MAFVVLAATGWGALLYVASWLGLQVLNQSAPPSAPYRPSPKASSPLNRLVAVGLITCGIVAFLRVNDLALPNRVGVPLALFGVGGVLAWHQSGWGVSSPGVGLPVVRITAGLAVAAAGLATLTLANLDITAAAFVLVVALVVLAGVALLLGPWLRQLLADLRAERLGRIRSEERARMAAHLHDSVLQTLALIQRNAQDPARTTSLARRQERELRSWLYADDLSAATLGPDDETVPFTRGEPFARGGHGLRRELERVAAEVEELHGMPIELVVVGDVAIQQPVLELAAATREAMVNAAKHSGAERIDVFAELRADGAEVFVRDLGKGFDVESVAPDRAGLASSIRDRMARIGGGAIVSSQPGEGTEVELRLPLSNKPSEGSERPERSDAAMSRHPR